MTSRPLRTSVDERVVCGVSGGLAEYFDVGVSVVRVGWLVLTCVTFGLAALAYCCLAVIMSRPGSVLDPPFRGRPRVQRTVGRQDGPKRAAGRPERRGQAADGGASGAWS